VKGAPKKTLVCIDRDGTINVDPGHFGSDANWRDQLELHAYAAEGIRRLKQAGISVVVTTNQAGVARDMFSLETMQETNKAIRDMLEQNGATVDGWYACPFVDPDYAARHGIQAKWLDTEGWRKPATGMIEQAKKDLSLRRPAVWSIGDRLTDVEMGLRANGKGILVLNGKNAQEHEKIKDLLEKYKNKIFAANNLMQAADVILQDQ
jgi:D-glycero-D-manno-heptose 1,7-bisphosphate phosphatase